ncbi:MAG TPA: family 16 glycoside hydrolase [Candidatus Polarisedimenticolia bacterium]|nr:family 16 glycoside hydrolase [Candidatus Polarisedimenticolia bacterium]
MRRFLAPGALVLTSMMAMLAGHSQPISPPKGSLHASFSKDQAERGKALYEQNCSKCHREDLKGNCPAENISGAAYVCSAPGSAPPLVGPSFLKRWYSVADLYGRVQWTMPTTKVNSLSESDNLNIVAYLLQANGIAAGNEELKAGAALKKMVINEKGASMGSTKKVNDPLNDFGISEAYYTEAQAERGKAYFYGACGRCHTADANGPNGAVEVSQNLGWRTGNPKNSYGLFVGEKWLASDSGIPGKPQRWDTVADLYNKIRTTQPAYNVAGLSTNEYLDIVAYLLKQNEFPSGNEELKDDVSQMRNMTLDKGFERLFNGKNLTGWGFLVGTNCTPAPEGCGQTTPGTTYTVDKATLFDSGTPHGMAYPKKKFWNFTLRTDYKFDPYPGMESDEDLYTNTGYLLFITEPGVWGRTLEIQGKNNFEMTIAMGRGESTVDTDDAARARARKPVGQWNAVEIVSKNGEVWSYLNGTLVTHVTKHPFTEAGYIGFQCESGPVHWRNIRIKAE